LSYLFACRVNNALQCLSAQFHCEDALANNAYVHWLLLLTAAASALQALQARRDTLQKRTDSLIRLKNEFQELSRVL
jgi:hypothetical protein